MFIRNRECGEDAKDSHTFSREESRKLSEVKITPKIVIKLFRMSQGWQNIRTRWDLSQKNQAINYKNTAVCELKELGPSCFTLPVSHGQRSPAWPQEKAMRNVLKLRKILFLKGKASHCCSHFNAVCEAAHTFWEHNSSLSIGSWVWGMLTLPLGQEH